MRSGLRLFFSVANIWTTDWFIHYLCGPLRPLQKFNTNQVIVKSCKLGKTNKQTRVSGVLEFSATTRMLCAVCVFQKRGSWVTILNESLCMWAAFDLESRLSRLVHGSIANLKSGGLSEVGFFLFFSRPKLRSSSLTYLHAHAVHDPLN